MLLRLRLAGISLIRTYSVTRIIVKQISLHNITVLNLS